MTNPTSNRKRLFFFLFFSILFILLIPVIVLYSTGYRLGQNLTLVSTGGVYVYYPESGVNISVNDEPAERTTIFAKSVLVQNLKPGKYTIKVTKDGYTEWDKKVTVVEKKVVEAYPFLISNPLATSTIPLDLQATVEKLFSTTTAATTTKTTGTNSTTSSTTGSRMISTSTFEVGTSTRDDSGITWKDIYLNTDSSSNNKELTALWKGDVNAIPFYFCGEEVTFCYNSIIATVSSSPITHFDFFPGRNDVVIYSNNDGVFVTELDKRGSQNFATLAKKTTSIDFRVYNGHIYIKDNSLIYEVQYE